ncbi:hypothetical protein MSBR2_0536 [Methanosarcina barkeri 227]|uniref:Uncharacterized protein n=4 Tax=Methanosarcina barkeri TaxID=2208 RepID=A0A0E3LNJ3_METBA|nr:MULTISPECIES: hypothetical protein [Methanosarcina]AKB54871.1 hypothetical protein MSBRM_1873 [Methanosarcina barkeri MS]AKB57052.1 hypothetical protein MSBR2_0536 [Methanosarcina barkeri 227]AKJ37616.1 hypothetical protein MCM1_0515 [Methanosarcina barkeri CM1]
MGTYMNYNNMTKDDFDRILYARIKEENLESIVNIPGVYEIVSKHFGSDRLRNEEITQSIVKIPGVYEIVSKHFNNDILEMWEYEQYIKVKDIVEKIGLWNPEFQRTSVLLKLLNELIEVLYGTLDLKLDKYVNLRALPVREFFKDVVDKYSDYPIWTCDFEGSCLVGAEKFEIEPVDSILQRFEDDE